MFGFLSVLGNIFSNPQTAQLFFAGSLAVQRTIERLSPETKAKIEAAIRWGVKQAAHFALETVLSDVAGRVTGLGADRSVAELATKVVERALVVGVDPALREANLAA